MFSLLTWPMMVGLAFLLRYDAKVIILISFAGCVFIFTSVGQMASAIIKAYERMEIFIPIGLLFSLTSLFLNIYVLKMGYSVTALIFVILIIEGLKSSVFLKIVQRHFVSLRLSFNIPVMLQIIRLSIPFAALMACAVLLHRIDLLMIGWLRPLEDVAIYGAAAKYLDFLSLLSGSLVGALFPALSSNIYSGKDNLWSIYHDSIGIFGILGFGAALSVTVLAEPIILLLFGEQYLIGSSALRWLGWAFLFSVLSGPAGTLLLAVGYQLDKLLLMGLFLLAISICLNFWLIPLYSYDGAAVATFVVAVVGFIGRSVLARKYFGRFPHLASMVWRAFVASCVMACIIVLIRELNLFITIAIGGFVYLSGLSILGEFREAKYQLVRTKISEILKRYAF
jgi:O-antigen/teichoic acid export membrane protein